MSSALIVACVILIYTLQIPFFFLPFFLLKALTHQELNESYKRFKRRITQRRKREVPPASTPWTPRGRREPGYELDPVRHRLQLDSPPGPWKQAVTCRDVQGTITETMHLRNTRSLGGGHVEMLDYDAFSGCWRRVIISCECQDVTHF